MLQTLQFTVIHYITVTIYNYTLIFTVIVTILSLLELLIPET